MLLLLFSFFLSNGDVADDRQLVFVCCGAVRGAELTVCWSACLSAAKVPPREPDRRLQGRDDDTVRGDNPIVLRKGK